MLWDYFQVNSVSIPGCMDPSYLNYNFIATIDDGSCNYAEGKDFDDVMAVAKTWDKWADDAFSVP